MNLLLFLNNFKSWAILTNKLLQWHITQHSQTRINCATLKDSIKYGWASFAGLYFNNGLQNGMPMLVMCTKPEKAQQYHFDKGKGLVWTVWLYTVTEVQQQEVTAAESQANTELWIVSMSLLNFEYTWRMAKGVYWGSIFTHKLNKAKWTSEWGRKTVPRFADANAPQKF